MDWNLGHFIFQACNATSKIIVNQEIEEAISSSCLILAQVFQILKYQTKFKYFKIFSTYYVAWKVRVDTRIWITGHPFRISSIQ